MADPLRIAELDYDTILANLRAWFQSQTVFKDYDFDGSSLAILLKNLAYNDHYGAFYVNMAANEGFIGNALLPRNIYAHAKTLNYLPGSKVCAKATANVTITPPSNYSGSSFTIPQYQQFVSEAIDGVNYSFVLNEDAIASRESSFGAEPFNFYGLILFQGDPLVIQYDVNTLTNPKLRFEIPSSNVDIETLTVKTQASSSNLAITPWTLASDITAIDANTNAYFLERSSAGTYVVYFGDGIIGAQPNTGNILILSYVVTAGDAANKAQYFTMLPLNNVSSCLVSTQFPASGGGDEESTDSIKASAPIYYSTQNRAMTKSDFQVIVPKDFPSVGSVSVWGGEENEPPIYGKVFIAISPKQGLFISQAEKDDIVTKLVSDRMILGITPEIIDPDYVYVRVQTSVEYDKSKTQVTRDAIVTNIRNTIIQYNEDNLRLFGSRFVLSKLAAEIDDVNPAILGNDTKVYVEKRFTPILGKSGTYTLNYNTQLKRGSVLEKLGSSPFQIVDSTGVERTAYFEEEQLSYTGVDDIVVTNPGSGYLEPPIVTVTGDGTGANATATIVNGRVQSITVTNKGQDYTTAVVTLTSVNGGSGATARPIISARFGNLRIYYYNDLNQKVIISQNAGTIDYLLGQIVVQAFTPSNYTDYISVWLQTEQPIIESSRGNILLIDDSDPASINIDLQAA